MAKNNLAHYEQILKSFEQSLKEICDQHEQMHDALTELKTHSNLAWHHLSDAWTQVLHLFTTVEQLRSIKLELQKKD